MRSLAALGALVIGLAALALPASARSQYVIDNAHIFSAAAVEATNQKISDFAATTRKEVVVYTTPAIDGTPQAAEEQAFAQQQVNGVLIFIAKSPKTIAVIPDKASRSFFPAGSTASIRTAIVASFNSGNFDAGLQNGTDLAMNMYRSHLRAGSGTSYAAPVSSGTSVSHTSQGSFGGMGWIFLILIFVVGFLILRAIFRAIFAPRMPMGGPMGGGPMMGGGMMGGPMMGGGYGGGGGGSFWSGLLGGLGGAFLGNELFRGGGIGGFGGGVDQAGFGGSQNTGGDQSGFQSDPGQADMGNASSGGWGDSGGGGGWGDTGGGGGGGGDWGGGGGGGDSGGGGW